MENHFDRINQTLHCFTETRVKLQLRPRYLNYALRSPLAIKVDFHLKMRYKFSERNVIFY